MTRYFLLPFETFVPESGPFRGRTGYRPKYSGELRYGFEMHHGKSPERDYCLIDVKPEHASDKVLDQLVSMPDVVEITDTTDDIGTTKREQVALLSAALPLNDAGSGRQVLQSLRESIKLRQQGLTKEQVGEVLTARRERIAAAIEEATRAGR